MAPLLSKQPMRALEALRTVPSLSIRPMLAFEPFLTVCALPVPKQHVSSTMMIHSLPFVLILLSCLFDNAKVKDEA
jgi:hypothetical protein